MRDKDYYIQRLLITLDEYDIQFSNVKNKEYVLLSAIERKCNSMGTTIDAFFHSMENECFYISPDEALISLPMPLIMKAVDSIRGEKNISKHYLSHQAEMDRSNYQKLYRSKGSINFVSFTKILNALEVDLLTFLGRCRDIKWGRY